MTLDSFLRFCLNSYYVGRKVRSRSAVIGSNAITWLREAERRPEPGSQPREGFIPLTLRQVAGHEDPSPCSERPQLQSEVWESKKQGLGEGWGEPTAPRAPPHRLATA